MKPELVTTGSGRYVRVQADHAEDVREYLLSHGIPCARPEPLSGVLWVFRLGDTANLGLVQALLDKWGGPSRRRWP